MIRKNHAISPSSAAGKTTLFVDEGANKPQRLFATVRRELVAGKLRDAAPFDWAMQTGF
ncbi:hypothetical protein [Andreprevotia sp. IGB-42]|uniref:hypothetical protein n=1 Tax=Andreprevotia sp. IGB-42 TaxID=2497473 RepID=UPI00135BD567|nr:hypothetical protein [Andreprevotia sp. IGB-42]